MSFEIAAVDRFKTFLRLSYRGLLIPIFIFSSENTSLNILICNSSMKQTCAFI